MEQLKAILDFAYHYLGTPSIFLMTAWCMRKCVKFAKDLTILQKAQKAQMRSQLLKDYETYKAQGYILQVQLDDWQNQYNAYHELVGANGVLDTRYKELLNMPTSPVPITSTTPAGN